MKTITLIMLGLFLLYIESNINAQSIYINSITTDRQSSGDSGYTLDGTFMTDSRAKLLCSDNFGVTGIYPKAISIFDGYGTTGSLTNISTVPIDNIFFFGAFNRLDPSTQQFTYAEIDSLYNWSLRGGKLIITTAPSLTSPASWDYTTLNSKWGFSVSQSSPGSFIPTSIGDSTDIFDGPFGTVIAAYQGGYLQGHFNSTPTNSKVLATDADGNPALIIDCNTLDLIISDVDGYTSLGGITSGDSINNSQDRFWTNTIAFMDRLQPLPQILSNNDSLSVDSVYNGYQWYLDGNAIPYATSPVYNITTPGSYQVEVIFNGGCVVRSNSIIISNIKEIGYNNLINIYPNPSSDKITITKSNNSSKETIINILNINGQQIMSYKFTNDNSFEIDVSKLTIGVYIVKIQIEDEIVNRKFVKSNKE